MGTLQSTTAHADKHYQSQYFGKGGAVAEARDYYFSARSNFENPECHVGTPSYATMKRFCRSKCMAYISTLCSALVPAIMRFRFIQVFQLFFELRAMVLTLRNEYGYKDLSPTEMEVLVAALTRMWPTRPTWVRDDVSSLFLEIWSHGDCTASTKLLLMARLSCWPSMSPEVSSAFRLSVMQFVHNTVTSGLREGVSWSTIARAASLVKDTKSMHIAAIRDGRPDVLLKYGTLPLRLKAAWKRF